MPPKRNVSRGRAATATKSASAPAEPASEGDTIPVPQEDQPATSTRSTRSTRSGTAGVVTPKKAEKPARSVGRKAAKATKPAQPKTEEPEPHVEEKPAVKAARGRPKAVAVVPKSPASKRGRKPIPETEEVDEVEVPAPAETVSAVVEPVQEKKGGRKVKAATSDPVEHAPIDNHSADAESKETVSEPAKRGRKPKSASVEPPKKDVPQAAVSEVDSVAPAAPAKRGRKPKATVVEPEEKADKEVEHALPSRDIPAESVSDKVPAVEQPSTSSRSTRATRSGAAGAPTPKKEEKPSRSTSRRGNQQASTVSSNSAEEALPPVEEEVAPKVDRRRSKAAPAAPKAAPAKRGRKPITEKVEEAKEDEDQSGPVESADAIIEPAVENHESEAEPKPDESKEKPLVEDGHPAEPEPSEAVVAPVPAKRGRKPKAAAVEAPPKKAVVPKATRGRAKPAEVVAPPPTVQETVSDVPVVAAEEKKDVATDSVSEKVQEPMDISPPAEPEKKDLETKVDSPAKSPEPQKKDLETKVDSPAKSSETVSAVATSQETSIDEDATEIINPADISMTEENETVEPAQSEGMEITPVETTSSDVVKPEIEETRKRKVDDAIAAPAADVDIPVKRPKLDVVSESKLKVVQLPTAAGTLMICGTDTTGEMGMREVGREKRRPTAVEDITEAVALVATGAMHTIVISKDGKRVYSFGCNDELALGRKTALNGVLSLTDSSLNETEEEIPSDVREATPTLVDVPAVRVVKATAGDSHTAILTEDGAFYVWGGLRDQQGKIGLTPASSPHPVASPTRPFDFEITVVDMASGDNHIVVLTDDGKVYTFGVAEQGQLGRVPENMSKFTSSTKELLLTPHLVEFESNTPVRCDRVWAGNFSSFARTVDGKIYAWGLNNYSQLGFKTRTVKNADLEGETMVLAEFYPVAVDSLASLSVQSIAGGSHHTLVLDADGHVHSFGRHHYGRLGHSDLQGDLDSPKVIPTLEGEKVTAIACGNDCSFAVTEKGHLYSWGMHSLHLGHSRPDEDFTSDTVVPARVTSKKLANAVFLSASSGSTHLATIVAEEQPNGTAN